MTERYAITCLLAVLLTASTTATAGFLTGGELLDLCNKPRDSFGRGACIGYITSSIDVHVTLSSWGESPRKICVVDNVKPNNLRRIVVRYLEQHRDRLHLTASGHVLDAFMKAYPCTK